MHDEIKRFHVEGFTDNNASTRDEVIREVEVMMRDEGFIPCLDLDPQYTVEYIGDEERFYFKLSVYGVLVGGEAWHTSGITSGKMIPRHSASPK